ncbi:MAG TPA: GntR family transcriptional regulator [Solirubrobacteraceae bacterium]|jgi:DNA-binding GntR family transcriptional regulator
MEPHLAALAGDGPPTGHRTLAEKAFDVLHRAIVTGQLSPGTRLPIEDLAEVLHMSPMPIREAVRRLDAVGLVENIPHRGARVTELSVSDLTEVYEIRLALEPLAVRRAADRFTPADEENARRRLAELDAMADDNSAATSEAHQAFHFALYGAAGSTWLLRMIRPVWEISERYCLALPESRQLKVRTGEHEAIVAACAARDGERAAGCLHDHLATTANNVAARMDHEPLFQVNSRSRAGRRAPRRRAP